MFLVLEKRLPVPHKGEKRPSESFLNSASKLMNLPDSEREWRIKVLTYVQYTFHSSNAYIRTYIRMYIYCMYVRM